MATVFARQVVRQLSTVSLQEGLAAAKLLSGLASKRQLSGDAATKVNPAMRVALALLMQPRPMHE